jgi:lauroyl/myristoyl acyltransferase
MIEKSFSTKIILEIIRTDDRESDVCENTQKYTTIIEAMVRRCPDQWFRVHQR